MYTPFEIGIRYLKYLLVASNGKGHGIHSPFVFEFITKVLNDKRKFYAYETIENLRQAMLIDRTKLIIKDFGAGSRINKENERQVSAIAASSLKPKKFGQLFFRMADRYAPMHVLELGTSLGITTCYLASANSNAQVITLEGSDAIAEIAQKNFNKLQLENISLVKGNFDDTLTNLLTKIEKIDLVFVDGNHKLEPTLRYFKQLLPKLDEHSILIFDDIHWSREMETAWKTIQIDPSVTLTIDLFFIGIVFFRKEQKEKQHFTIRF